MKSNQAVYIPVFLIFVTLIGCSGEQQNNKGREPSKEKESVVEMSGEKYNNALEFLKSKKQFSMFTEAIYKYGFDTVLLKSDVAFTILALTDKAPDNIPQEVRIKLDADVEGSRLFLSRHIIPLPVLIEGDSIIEAVALSGDRFTFRKSKEGYFANDVLLSNCNIKAGKDIVHSTDNLLFMPE